jgi:fumarate reductase flavoprotein subunit
MAEYVRQQFLQEPDEEKIKDAVGKCERPFANAGKANLEGVREKLYDVMWEKVGIIRDGAGLERAQSELESLDAELDRAAVTAERAFNLTWHDWLNLKSLVAVSRAITLAAAERRDSRGAHFRSDFPECGSLEESTYTSIKDGSVSMKPVRFARVGPGQTLLRNVA